MDIIKFAKLTEDAKIPTKREGDGCYDLYASFEGNEIMIEPHKTALIPTGVCSTFPPNYRIALRERGSNTKWGAIVMAGQIDSNYTGEYFVAIHNSNDIPIEITKIVDDVTITEDFIQFPYSKAICQFAVEDVPQVIIQETTAEYIQSLNTERGDGKLGSSKK